MHIEAGLRPALEGGANDASSACADGASFSVRQVPAPASDAYVSLRPDLPYDRDELKGAKGDDEVQIGTLEHLEAQRDRKSTRLNSSHIQKSRMPSSA